MVNQRSLVWALLVALAVAACLAACTKQRDARFPHVAHLTGIRCGGPGEPDCLTCNSCHSPSQRERAHKLPDAGLCARCHDDDLEQVAHVLEVVPPRPHGDITFDHDLHLGMKEIEGQCVRCHAGVVREGQATIPPMSRCFTCHEHEAQWNRAECAPCHQRGDLENTLPVTFLAHDEHFLRRHRDEAMHDRALCASCHTQSECQACHDLTQKIPVERRFPERIERSFVHRGDFMTRHAIDAASEPAKCMSCHTERDCDSCHVERGVSGNALGARNPHPPGWVGNDVGASDFHGRHARRDIVACASCHEQGPATNCIRCHKVGAYGGNPHPRGWQSARGRASSMCRYCHEP